MVLFYIGMLVFVGLISYVWVRGIDYMNEHHPDYKGEDLFGEDVNKKSEPPKEQ